MLNADKNVHITTKDAIDLKYKTSLLEMVNNLKITGSGRYAKS